MSTDSELTGIMNANLPTNGTGDIDAAEHRNVVGALISSKLSREDDATKIGLLNLDPARAYVVGEGFIFNGAIYQSIFGHAPGENPTSPGTATFQRLTQVPVIETFTAWADDVPYDTGDTIRRNYKLYESLIDDNLDNDPALEDPLVNWVEVSASENVWGQVYQTGTSYEKRQVIFNESTGYFYWLNSPGNTYTSTDFAAENTAGIWQIFISAKKIYPLYVRNVGSVLLNTAHMDSLYSTDELGQNTESSYQVAEKTGDGWSFLKKNPNQLIPDSLDLTDSDFFDSNELDVSTFEGADLVTLEGNGSPTDSTIDTMVGLSDNFKIRFKIGTNESITFTHNSLSTATVNQLVIEGGATIELTAGDEIEFRRDGIINKNTSASTY